MEYQDCLFEETVDREYKEFTFYGSGCDIVEQDDALILIRNGNFIFNKMVMKNLLNNIDYYLPKYFTAFVTSQSKSKIGEMYLGIDDFGFVHGIPFNSDINKKIISDKIHKVLKDRINVDDEFNYSNHFSWELIEINKPNRKIKSNHNEIISLYFEEIDEHTKIINKFNRCRTTWYKLLNRYNSRLHIMMNCPDRRKELIEYIKSKDSKAFKVINLLKSNYQFPPAEGTLIKDLKKNKNNPWYWVTRWKDEKGEFLKSIKPKAPILNLSNNLSPISHICSVSNMIPQWINNNEELKLYVIKFNFKRSNKDISYINYGDELKCFRTMGLNGPCCSPY